MKKKVAILFGGCSTEYSVSLQSAYALISHLNKEKYEGVLIGITREGTWLRYRGSLDKIKNDTWFTDESCVSAMISPSREVQGIIEFYGDKVKQEHVDVVFPIIHGKNGEDGTLQGLLELAGIPFVGCNTLSSALCMDKDLAHLVAQGAGVKVAPFVIVRKYDDFQQKLKETETLKYPLFVKPSKAGSSFGITKIDNKNQLIDALQLAFIHDDKVVIEEAVEGFEVGCAVLGNEELIMGALDEIELQKGFFDHKEKYTLETSKIHIPARITSEKAKEMKETAAILYRALECRGLARVDMFLTPKGEIFFNEINTIPGFTSHSRYPSMLSHTGLAFEETIDQLIGLVTEDEKNRTY
ncbi:vancomycin/teicoplanin A-type resistance protein VanA [Clostridium aceticum]|uniref:D-alanine--D-alanine ligase n=1 Tax=Clostridium aceticum TaxID=84022 RepID=A0A0D8I9U5_9CLOT|nr:D-alanine--D-serine ligase VanG [Clostridium aceticum]AKL95993.1 vancomycin/teicoplanin A-type resistance protein VanA [Clostridium aceticum]KJF27065.1 D-alanine--D-alanine ligase [Clostridium aceticum]